jgi:hypothetical protein
MRILEHSIVGQSLTSLTIRKGREHAGCRICGAVFQARLAIETPDDCYTLQVQALVAAETREWRDRHNKRHNKREHLSFRASGRTYTPEAALRLAPFGFAALDSVEDEEVAQAMLEAPRAPFDDVDTTLRGWR